MPKESTKATITSFAGTPLVRVVDGSNSRNISPANLVAESGAQTALDGRYLLESNNLSDLDNTATARTNLGVAGLRNLVVIPAPRICIGGAGTGLTRAVVLNRDVITVANVLTSDMTVTLIPSSEQIEHWNTTDGSLTIYMIVLPVNSDSGNVRWRRNWYAATASGEVLPSASGPTTGVNVALPGVTNQLTWQNIGSGAFPNPDPDDVFSLAFNREGTSGSDTSSESVHLLGVALEFTPS